MNNYKFVSDELNLQVYNSTVKRNLSFLIGSSFRITRAFSYTIESRNIKLLTINKLL